MFNKIKMFKFQLNFSKEFCQIKSEIPNFMVKYCQIKYLNRNLNDLAKFLLAELN